MSEQRFREMAEKLLEPYVVFREIKHGVVEDVEGFEKVITHALAKVEAETVERCAVFAENYLVTNKVYAGIANGIRSLIK